MSLFRLNTGAQRIEVVEPGDDIQTAINTVNSEGGGTVLLMPGIHQPPTTLVLGANVTLKGFDPYQSILEVTFTGLDAIDVTQVNWSIEGIHFRANDPLFGITAFIHVTGGSQWRIQGCTFSRLGGFGVNPGPAILLSALPFFGSIVNNHFLAFSLNAISAPAGTGLLHIDISHNLFANFGIPAAAVPILLRPSFVLSFVSISSNRIVTSTSGNGIDIVYGAMTFTQLGIVDNDILNISFNGAGNGILLDMNNIAASSAAVVGNRVLGFNGVGGIGIETLNVPVGTNTVSANAAVSNATDFVLAANTIAVGNA